ncbi:MAG: ParB N-terminal domain-containing protein [Anaerolineae bacterium]|nr:ParB N-terminal domain-containing protein [Anaerolineae bacterium]
MTEIPTPDLRIVPVSHILPHEPVDEQRAQPLVRSIERDGVLKNPIIVTPLTVDEGGEEFALLDGTNRHYALSALKIEHALVQVVQYGSPLTELQTWYHVITGIHFSELTSCFDRVPGLHMDLIDLRDARSLLERQEIIAYCIFQDGHALAFTTNAQDRIGRMEALKGLVDSYVDTGQLNRTALSDLPSLRQLYPDMAGAIIFGGFHPEDVLAIARRHLRAPSGVTRHVIHGRALRINYPLEKLASDLPLARKNEELLHWMQSRFSDRAVRLYAEATYMFDE